LEIREEMEGRKSLCLMKKDEVVEARPDALQQGVMLGTFGKKALNFYKMCDVGIQLKAERREKGKKKKNPLEPG